MKKILLTFSITLILGSAFAQGYYDEEDSDNIKIQRTSEQSARGSLNYYMNEKWQVGTLFTTNSTPIVGYTFRYNVYTDQIELRSVVDASTLDYVSIGTMKFIHTNFYDEDEAMFSGYFEMLINGDCKLLKRRELKYNPGSYKAAYTTQGSTAILESLYIKVGNKPAQKIQKSREFFEKVFSENEKMLEFINKKNFLIVSDKKIKSIIEYYNDII